MNVSYIQIKWTLNNFSVGVYSAIYYIMIILVIIFLSLLLHFLFCDSCLQHGIFLIEYSYSSSCMQVHRLFCFTLG